MSSKLGSNRLRKDFNCVEVLWQGHFECQAVQRQQDSAMHVDFSIRVVLQGCTALLCTFGNSRVPVKSSPGVACTPHMYFVIHFSIAQLPEFCIDGELIHQCYRQPRGRHVWQICHSRIRYHCTCDTCLAYGCILVPSRASRVANVYVSCIEQECHPRKRIFTCTHGSAVPPALIS